MHDYHTRIKSDKPDTHAPDGSEIRLLTATGRGSMVHCTLQPGQVSLAVTYLTVEELWYVVDGTGELWRKQGNREEITELWPGMSVSIPLDTDFQFRCTGVDPLECVIVTNPPWPGEHEAVRVPDYWPVDR